MTTTAPTTPEQDPRLCFEAYAEKGLSWKQHHAIHEALNLAYSFRTKLFVDKTYGHVKPVKRILCTLDDLLIGHIAIFEDEAIFKEQKIKIAGLGMILSLKPMSLIGAILRRKALDICAERGFSFAIGRVRNCPRVKKHLEPFTWCFLEIPLIGANTKSHSTEILAIFNTGLSKNKPEEIINYFQESKKISIDKEIF